jgi:hypothetical protein
MPSLATGGRADSESQRNWLQQPRIWMQQPRMGSGRPLPGQRVRVRTAFPENSRRFAHPVCRQHGARPAPALAPWPNVAASPRSGAARAGHRHARQGRSKWSKCGCRPTPALPVLVKPETYWSNRNRTGQTGTVLVKVGCRPTPALLRRPEMAAGDGPRTLALGTRRASELQHHHQLARPD